MVAAMVRRRRGWRRTMIIMMIVPYRLDDGGVGAAASAHGQRSGSQKYGCKAAGSSHLSFLIRGLNRYGSLCDGLLMNGDAFALKAQNKFAPSLNEL
jgi:hypothetical protein